jgi:hypothetical protein
VRFLPLYELVSADYLPDLVHCSMLAEDAIKSAIQNYYTKNPKATTTNLSSTSPPIPEIKVETVMGNAVDSARAST